MQIEFKFDNVYAELPPPKPPTPEKPKGIEMQIQTEKHENDSQDGRSAASRLLDLKKA